VGERLERAPGLTVQTVAVPAGPGEQPPVQPAGLSRGASRFFRRHPWASLTALITWPLLWLIVIYLGSLAVLVVSAFFSIDEFTNETTTDFTMGNIEEVLGTRAYTDTVIRSVGVAAAVTVLSLVIALPLAFYIAKLAKPWARRALIVSATLPLWAGYLVKAYAMRAVFEPGGSSGGGGFLEGAIGWTPGFGLPAVVLTLTYLWIPYMILPIYAGLDRLPSSLLDASGDLGGRPFRTFRSVILPLLVPAIAAGSIFTFSLSLGDYITVKIVGSKTQLIGNLIERTLLAPNVPLAAAFTLWPIVIMVAYLIVMARLGAFESL
jgi:putative spermidine/putrescine transport system permease protein